MSAICIHSSLSFLGSSGSYGSLSSSGSSGSYGSLGSSGSSGSNGSLGSSDSYGSYGSQGSSGSSGSHMCKCVARGRVILCQFNLSSFFFFLWTQKMSFLSVLGSFSCNVEKKYNSLQTSNEELQKQGFLLLSN